MFLITGILILIYLLYPLWLMTITSVLPEKEKETEDISSVSMVLLSYNGKEYLKEKVDFLIRELSCFQHYELIIVDDNSTDGSRELLNDLCDTENIRLILKSRQKGIPDSMNLGVKNAKYEYIIFCDQRQKLSGNILRHIVEPLKYKKTGAVSGCICHLDKQNRCSLIRRHENFIKAKESRAGSLIGVYGPFYAIKKQYYSVIPDDIILDDLYLSLRILKTKQIEIREDCRIIDESFSYLNDYRRTRRYVSGFMQILKDKTIIRDLSARQKTMLIWHKYIRLFIPLFLFLSYISAGIMIMQGIGYLILFCLLTIGGLLSFVPLKVNSQFRMKNLVRINILYFIALSDIFINEILLRRSAVSGRRSTVSGQHKAVEQ
jgi:glycosyltransferase involved in cell wall biosynthesis